MSKSVSCILMGAPGSGKGTQAKRLSEEFNIPHISTGDILRAEIAAKTELGKKVEGVLAAGQLVNSDMINALVESRFTKPDVQRGFILDGYPRSLEQVKFLEGLLKKKGMTGTKVILLDLNHDALVGRIVGRLTCAQCGRVYHRNLNPPKKAGVCDSCGSTKLVERKDDSEETVVKRLKVYDEETAPVLGYYEAKGEVIRVDAGRPVSQIEGELKKILA